MADVATEPVDISGLIDSMLAGRPRLSPLAHELGQRIVAEELAPGAALSERMFGDDRKVSRTSFREAVKVLEGKGLVASRQNTGTKVTPRRLWNMLDPEVLAWRVKADGVNEFVTDFLDFRRAVEPSAAEAAALRGNGELITEMRDAFTTMVELESEEPFGERYVQADVKFHRALFAGSENEFFVALGRILEVPMMLSFLLHSQLHVGPSNRLALHEQLLLRIEAGDGDGARDAVLQLLSNVEDDVSRLVAE